MGKFTIDKGAPAFPSFNERGITIREHFSLQLMTGMLAKGKIDGTPFTRSEELKELSRRAVMAADELIEALDNAE